MILNVIRQVDLVRRFYRSRAGQAWIEKKLTPVLPHLSPTDNCVDIGCGNGLIVEALRTKGFSCEAVDVADLSIVPEVEVTVYDGLHLPYPDQHFDTAMLLTVLHHTPDPIPVLKEAARVARRLILVEDVYNNPIQQYMTYGMDTLVNLGHSAMTYQNKSDAEWRATFEDLRLRLLKCDEQSILLFFQQNTYLLEHQ